MADKTTQPVENRNFLFYCSFTWFGILQNYRKYIVVLKRLWFTQINVSPFLFDLFPFHRLPPPNSTQLFYSLVYGCLAFLCTETVPNHEQSTGKECFVYFDKGLLKFCAAGNRTEQEREIILTSQWAQIIEQYESSLKWFDWNWCMRVCMCLFNDEKRTQPNLIAV